MLVLDPCLNETCYSPLTSRVSTLARGGADCSMWTVFLLVGLYLQITTMCYVKMLSVILYSSPTQFIPGQHLRVFEKFSYDAYGQNVRVLASGKDGSETFFVDRLLLYREVKYHSLR